MNFYLLIPFFIILILFVPIRIEARGSFNVLERSGAVGLFIFGIKVAHEQLWLENRKIITKKDNNLESHELNIESTSFIFLKMFIYGIINKARLKELFVFYNLGINDAFKSAMLGGYVNVALLTLMTSIKNYKPTASMGVYDTISYNEKVMQFSSRSLMTISLLDVVYSLGRSVILTKKIKSSAKAEKEAE